MGDARSSLTWLMPPPTGGRSVWSDCSVNVNNSWVTRVNSLFLRKGRCEGSRLRLCEYGLEKMCE